MHGILTDTLNVTVTQDICAPHRMQVHMHSSYRGLQVGCHLQNAKYLSAM